MHFDRHFTFQNALNYIFFYRKPEKSSRVQRYFFIWPYTLTMVLFLEDDSSSDLPVGLCTFNSDTSMCNMHDPESCSSASEVIILNKAIKTAFTYKKYVVGTQKSYLNADLLSIQSTVTVSTLFTFYDVLNAF